MSNEVLKNNRKQIPQFVRLPLFLFILGIICATILAFVNNVTAPVIEKAEAQAIKDTLNNVGLADAVDVTDKYELATNVVAVYEGKNESGVKSYCFQVAHKNKFTTVTTFVLINSETSKVENIKINGNATTLGQATDKLFLNSVFGVIGSTSEDYQDNFEIIANATWSSKSVEAAVKASFKQLAVIAGGQNE